MLKCVYCKKEMSVNRVYFCEKCKETITEKGINTGKAMGDWIIAAYWYLENNNGNYWKNQKEIDEEEKNLQFIRPIDYIRFDRYRKCIGANPREYAMNAKHLNEMEKWYLECAESMNNTKEKLNNKE